MNKFVLISILCTLSFFGYSTTQDKVFNEVHRVVESNDGNVYVITDKGTWLVSNRSLVRIDTIYDQVVPLKDHQQLMPQELLGVGNQWRGWAGVGFTLLAILMVFGYIYYQQNIGYRREVYLKRVQRQRQILNIAFWASGDEVLDCDLENNKVIKLNQNSEFDRFSQIHFRSEQFIERIHPEDRATFRSHFDALLSSGDNNYELTYRIQSKHRGWLCLVERGCIIERDKQGRALRLISCMRDVTLLHNEQEQLIRTIKELDQRLRITEAELNQE